jgi:hypothetical protein
MFWKTTALIAAAVLTMAAAAPKSNPAKPAAAKAPAAAAKPAPAKPLPVKPAAPVSPVANFDARNPTSVMAVLNSSGGKATLVTKDADIVVLNFVSPAANFTLQFESCDAQGRACKAVAFDFFIDQPGPTFAQLNAFNQTSVMCRGYEDKAGKPHVVYSTLLFADDPYDHFRTETLAWTGCIAEFRNFVRDPNGYLASAP